MEEATLREAGQGLTGPAKEAAMLAVVSTPIPIFNCPTRRAALAYPLALERHANLANNLTSCLGDQCLIARSDYQANSGNGNAIDPDGPGSYAEAATRDWEAEDGPGRDTFREQFGITYERSAIRIPQITDGTSKTAMVGEKYRSSSNYINGLDSADDQNIFVGHDRDMNGYTYLFNPNPFFPYYTYMDRTPFNAAPLQDRHGYELLYHFGSAHPTGIHMAMCDASVQTINYDISPEVFAAMGGREDGATPLAQ
jgi:hypothetical protein